MNVAPANPSDTTPMNATPPMNNGTSLQRGDGKLTVSVPEDAKIYVNNYLTTTPGTVREYISRNLNIGEKYAYEIRAEVVRDGKVITETKKIDLQAGAANELAFDFPAASEQVETSLTLQVPANAKVTLGGNETSATGEVRVFKSKLAAGTEWKDYLVEISWEVDGRVVREQKVFDLKAGENKEISLDAAEIARLADRR
jgi:uncharacterized protein (TIGR03000 family)